MVRVCLWVLLLANPCRAFTTHPPSIYSKLNMIAEEEVYFPPALTTTQRLKRSATFLSTAIPILLSYFSLDAKIKLQQRQGKCFTDEECELLYDSLHEEGALKLADAITSLKGFYVKAAQIISSRKDMFPSQYTEALDEFFDDVDPMPTELVRAVVSKELLNADESFSDVFSQFDEVPLGSASVAQVHRAVLTDKYGGGEVAVKVQRPSIESKLLGDAANLIAITKPLRDTLPLDYYTVFCELEKQLKDEFDFVSEASAMERIRNSLGADANIVIPRVVKGLVCKRVLVMEYLKGVPLSRIEEKMKERGMDPNGPEAKLFARKLLKSLTNAFGRSILETGFFHADPHPGNIFVLDDGSVGLIDFGQVKQISGRNRETLAKVMVALDSRTDNPQDLDKIGKLALELGVTIKKGAKKEAAAAVACWLFDGSVQELPGGYDMGELSPNSPAKELDSFPQDLVLVGRSTILIKGLSNRLEVPWSLAKEWAPIAKRVLSPEQNQERTRFRDVGRTLRKWSKGRFTISLPSPIITLLARLLLRVQKLKVWFKK